MDGGGGGQRLLEEALQWRAMDGGVCVCVCARGIHTCDQKTSLDMHQGDSSKFNCGGFCIDTQRVCGFKKPSRQQCPKEVRNYLIGRSSGGLSWGGGGGGGGGSLSIYMGM